MQEVQLDKKVTLLDCPGLVMAGGNKTDASVALRNAIKVIILNIKHRVVWGNYGRSLGNYGQHHTWNKLSHKLF